jgi:hypothetical protein
MFKKIIALEERYGQTYIRIEGSKISYKAYTVDQWIKRRQVAGYSVNNAEYVRSCCRRQLHKRGQENKLPTGFDAAKYKNRIYIYELFPFDSIPSSAAENKIIPYENVTLDNSFDSPLRSFKYQAIINKVPIKLEMIFYPNGNIKWRPISGAETSPTIAKRGLLFTTAWLVEIAHGCYPNINLKLETQKYFNTIISMPSDHTLLMDFWERCLWCAGYKSPHSKKNTRYHQSHRSKFFAWKKQVVNEYKQHYFTPKINFKAEGVSALLEHPLIINALHRRLTEIYGLVAKSKN